MKYLQKNNYIQKMLKKNLANILTGSRIIATFLLSIIIDKLLSGQQNIRVDVLLLFLFLIIWLSDMADGKVARKLKITSSFGAMFDVIADNIFVFLIHIQLAKYQVAPVWFILLMLEKIVNYLVSSYLVSKKKDDKFAFIRDPIGKVVSASYFVTPLILLIAYLVGDEAFYIANVLIHIIALFGIWSSVYRLGNVMQLTIFRRNTKEKGLTKNEK